MGYRHVPLSRRLGLAFDEEAHWRLAMPQAECFMYFVAQMQRLFGPGHTLYVEGRGLDPEVAGLYAALERSDPPAVAALSRGAGGRRYHVSMGGRLTRALNELAARKTYAQVGERMLVYDDTPKVLMDASRLGERLVRLSGTLPEADVRRFAAGKLHGELEWVAV